MAFRIPPHVGWPLFVVGLLAVGVVTCVVTVLAARSGGGAQVVTDYYRRAVDWNETVALQAASDALGWETEVHLSPATGDTQRRLVEIVIRDRDTRPVKGLQGIVRCSRPHLAGTVAEAPLRALPDRPGVYHVQLPIDAPGLWDFHIDAVRDQTRFLTHVRKEIALAR